MRAHGPPWSSEDAHAISPYRDTVPYVGFTPTVAVSAAGWRIDPPVSDPMASGAWNALRPKFNLIHEGDYRTNVTSQYRIG